MAASRDGVSEAAAVQQKLLFSFFFVQILNCYAIVL